MRDRTMNPYRKILYCVLLVALMGVSGLEAWLQISWIGQVTAGFRTTFNCSSYCFPNCTHTWFFLGRTITGNSLSWTPDGLDSTVELQCSVLDPKTGISNSMTSIIEVENPVSVQISGPNTVASLNESLDLVCHVDTRSSPLSGPSGQVVWYKDGQKVIPREKIQHDTSLHFDSLLPSDAGFYQCETYVAMGQSSVFSLGYLLSFDPWNISISGPDTVFPDRLSKFTCLVSCTLNVDCTVRWQFRGGFPIGIHFSVHENELKWIPSIPGTFQNFTCIVENAAAGRSVEANKMVEVKGTLLSGSEAGQLNRLLIMMISSLGLLVLFDS